MYSIVLAIAIGILVGIGSSYIPYMNWGWGIAFGVVGALLTLFFISRRLVKVLEPSFNTVQKQIQAKQFPLALKTLEDIKHLGKWQILLKTQIMAQIGMIYYAQKNEEKAIEHLSQAHPRFALEAKLALASILVRRKAFDDAIATLKPLKSMHKKNPLVHNIYAWVADKKGDREDAMNALSEALKKIPENEATQKNLLSLQNNKRMNMKPFGMSWYQLQLEKPPMSMMQDQFAGRAGFRQKKRIKS